ncbi:MAG: M3 family oligoendopeptidase [Acidaminobacteraceae bacterium]
MNWNLDSLYPSFNSNEFKSDLTLLDNLICDYDTWSKQIESSELAPKIAIESYIKKYSEIKGLVLKLYAFSSLSFSTDTKNDDATSYMSSIREYDSKIVSSSVTFSIYLNSLEMSVIEQLCNSSDIIMEHKFHLFELIGNSKYMLSKSEEIILSKLKSTGSNAWETLQNKATASLTVDIEIDGELKSLPLQVVRNMAFDDSSETRKKAYYAELKAYEKIQDISAAAINSIKGEVIAECDLRGFASPLEKTLFDSRMSSKTLDSMMDAIKEFIPKFSDYYKRKAKILGHQNSLPMYDIFAPITSSDKKISYDEAMTFITTHFASFSKELSNFAEQAFDKNWVDSAPRQGKRGGAFCSNIRPIKESRILTNFTGSLNNVITLAHELGHGYHGHKIFEEEILNCSYPMPLAETASIFCETIVKNAAINSAGDKEALSILETSIQGYGQVIVDIYSRYLFETELFASRTEKTLSVDELKELMLDSQRKAYGDSLDHDYLHPYMWVNKTHYYYASRNFYNYPYAFGLLFAKGLYNIYLGDKSTFIIKYDNMLGETGKNSIEDTAILMGIDVSSKEFWSNSLKEIEKEIDKFLDLTK